MRVTIIRDDNVVNVNGERHAVDCSDLPADFHALQWNGTSGEVEYSMTTCAHCNARSKKSNVVTSDFRPYQKYFDAWNVAKIAADKAAAEAEAVAAKARADAAGPQT